MDAILTTYDTIGSLAIIFVADFLSELFNTPPVIRNARNLSTDAAIFLAVVVAAVAAVAAVVIAVTVFVVIAGSAGSTVR